MLAQQSDEHLFSPESNIQIAFSIFSQEKKSSAPKSGAAKVAMVDQNVQQRNQRIQASQILVLLSRYLQLCTWMQAGSFQMELLGGGEQIDFSK